MIVSSPVLHTYFYNYWVGEGPFYGIPYICNNFIDKHFKVRESDKIILHVSDRPLEESVKVRIKTLDKSVHVCWKVVDGIEDSDTLVVFNFLIMLREIGKKTFYLQVEIV